MSAHSANAPSTVWEAVIGVLLSAVGAYYYLRIVKIMYFDEPAKAFDRPGSAARVVLALSTAIVIFYAFAPAPLTDAAMANEVMAWPEGKENLSGGVMMAQQ